MQAMKFVILGVLVSLCSSQEIEPRQKPLSVCEILQQRVDLMGRIVSVRGEVKAGGHGAYLIAAPACTFKLTTAGVTWPNFIYLEYPANKSPFESSHAPFEVDWISVRRAERQALRQGYNSATDQLFETFTGLLVSFDKLDDRASPAAPMLKRPGFGPAGLDAPAQLLIKSVADVVVVRGPKK
jgi:hypothetical protein